MGIGLSCLERPGTIGIVLCLNVHGRDSERIEGLIEDSGLRPTYVKSEVSILSTEMLENDGSG